MPSSFCKHFIGHVFTNDQMNMNDQILRNNWSGKQMSEKSFTVKYLLMMNFQCDFYDHRPFYHEKQKLIKI